jgi:hypothetical protein
MVGLSGLWMPIVLSAVAVFIASSLIHMVLKWHRAEYKEPPNGAAVADALRPFKIPPGEYYLPFAGGGQKEMDSPEFQARVKAGPNLSMIVRPNEMANMGVLLGQWFVYCLVVSLFTAYITGRALPQGAEYLRVFQIAGATAFAGYVLALWQAYIWFAKPMRYMIFSTLDGLIYALLTGGIFGWLWMR